MPPQDPTNQKKNAQGDPRYPVKDVVQQHIRPDAEIHYDASNSGHGPLDDTPTTLLPSERLRLEAEFTEKKNLLQDMTVRIAAATRSNNPPTPQQLQELSDLSAEVDRLEGRINPPKPSDPQRPTREGNWRPAPPPAELTAEQSYTEAMKRFRSARSRANDALAAADEIPDPEAKAKAKAAAQVELDKAEGLIKSLVEKRTSITPSPPPAAPAQPDIPLDDALRQANIRTNGGEARLKQMQLTAVTLAAQPGNHITNNQRTALLYLDGRIEAFLNAALPSRGTPESTLKHGAGIARGNALTNLESAIRRLETDFPGFFSQTTPASTTPVAPIQAEAQPAPAAQAKPTPQPQPKPTGRPMGEFRAVEKAQVPPRAIHPNPITIETAYPVAVVAQPAPLANAQAQAQSGRTMGEYQTTQHNLNRNTQVPPRAPETARATTPTNQPAAATASPQATTGTAPNPTAAKPDFTVRHDHLQHLPGDVRNVTISGMRDTRAPAPLVERVPPAGLTAPPRPNYYVTPEHGKNPPTVKNSTFINVPQQQVAAELAHRAEAKAANKLAPEAEEIIRRTRVAANTDFDQVGSRGRVTTSQLIARNAERAAKLAAQQAAETAQRESLERRLALAERAFEKAVELGDTERMGKAVDTIKELNTQLNPDSSGPALSANKTQTYVPPEKPTPPAPSRIPKVSTSAKVAGGLGTGIVVSGVLAGAVENKQPGYKTRADITKASVKGGANTIVPGITDDFRNITDPTVSRLDAILNGLQVLGGTTAVIGLGLGVVPLAIVAGTATAGVSLLQDGFKFIGASEQGGMLYGLAKGAAIAAGPKLEEELERKPKNLDHTSPIDIALTNPRLTRNEARYTASVRRVIEEEFKPGTDYNHLGSAIAKLEDKFKKMPVEPQDVFVQEEKIILSDALKTMREAQEIHAGTLRATRHALSHIPAAPKPLSLHNIPIPGVDIPKGANPIASEKSQSIVVPPLLATVAPETARAAPKGAPPVSPAPAPKAEPIVEIITKSGDNLSAIADARTKAMAEAREWVREEVRAALNAESTKVKPSNQTVLSILRLTMEGKIKPPLTGEKKDKLGAESSIAFTRDDIHAMVEELKKRDKLDKRGNITNVDENAVTREQVLAPASTPAAAAPNKGEKKK